MKPNNEMVFSVVLSLIESKEVDCDFKDELDNGIVHKIVLLELKPIYDKGDLKLFERILVLLKNSKAIDMYIRKVLSMVQDIDFHISNRGVLILKEFSEEIKNKISQEIKVEFVYSLIVAAGRGANESKAAINNFQYELTDFLESFIQSLLSNEESLNELLNKVIYLDKVIKVLIENKPESIIQMLNNFYSGWKVDDEDKYSYLLRCIKSINSKSLYDYEMREKINSMVEELGII